ncbi:MAG TPA: HDOD domain-containing protein [Deltaproteobacteria bacterium]|nr:HDOD domain-containing protein [Deltaproteobacteria bacterium]HQJ09096.1 HDOD domain-containing protein [Deltaproteobacteria bacterium]
MSPDLNIDVRSVPVLPELADQIIRMVLEDDISLEKMAGLIEKDQALTARLLSLANSSYYKRSREVYTVRDAITLVGFDAVRTLALGVSVLDMFPTKKRSSLDHKAFWRHSIACALFAEAMMETVSAPNAPKAFCAGLLHDVGKMILDIMKPDEYAVALKLAREEPRPLIDIEKQIFGNTHCDVGREVLVHWRLPHIYEECVWCHHAPLRILDDEQYQISGIVHIANILAHMVYAGASGNNHPQKITSPLLKGFGLNPDTLDALIERIPKQIDTICSEIGIGKPVEGLFGIINRANTRLADLSLKLQQKTAEAVNARQYSETLIELLGDLNASTRISDALEKAAGRLLDAGYIRGFLGGVHAGGQNLVYEVSREHGARFSRVGDDELKAMILANRSFVGASLSSGVFVYLEPAGQEIGDNQKFLSSLMSAISSSLRRIYMENALYEEKDTLRKALQSASEEKQKAEEILRLNQELVEASSYGLCLVDEANVVRVENERSLEVRRELSISDKDIIKQLDVSSRSELHELKDAIVSRKEASILCKNHTKAFRISTRPIKVNKWLLVMFSDITRELEDERRKVAYARISVVGNLAASMAHNMKSPLGAIHGFGSMIKDDLSKGKIRVTRDGQEDQDFMDMISNIITASENLLKIVNQLLNFTRKWESPEAEISVEGFIDGIFQIISAQANSAGVNLDKNIELNTVRIKAEAVEQVLINLMTNAIKASAQGLQVVVGASRKDGGIEFSVSDSGIGMDRDQIPKIFDPLYTAWPVRTGMGLGLSLVKDIVDSMGGRIEVASSPGKGSTFSVWIPEGKG